MKGHRWFAAVYDVLNRAGERGVLAPLRRRLLGPAQGRVLEIGAGTGASFPHYGAGAQVVATEPDPYMLRRARPRAFAVSAGNRPILLVQCVAEALPFKAGSFDAATAALVLCTVDDQARALAEVKRVLCPGGVLRFIEHVRGAGRLGEAQDAITPLWRRLGAGCEPNRRTGEQIAAAGFALKELEEQSLFGGVPLIAGVAVAP